MRGEGKRVHGDGVARQQLAHEDHLSAAVPEHAFVHGFVEGRIIDSPAVICPRRTDPQAARGAPHLLPQLPDDIGRRILSFVNMAGMRRAPVPFGFQESPHARRGDRDHKLAAIRVQPRLGVVVHGAGQLDKPPTDQRRLSDEQVRGIAMRSRPSA